ncbi:inositol 2-dehydrogenase [Oceanobacillus oncorhynchi subsp. oncorhynchi]|uniref:inositol 2-dehydrogenase n=1 Tax=Oceanobacillus oncorhynchi TaxID=545501 RepID=UPI0031D9E005
MDKLTVAVIGAGRIGQLHIGNMLKSDLYQLKVISDVYIDHLKGSHLEDSGVLITKNIDDIFQDPEIDAVFICSSTDTHADYIIQAAKAKKHIFCEKPISFNEEDTMRALEEVRENNVNLQIGFNRRFDKHFSKVQHAVVEGHIGTPQIIKITSRDPQAPAIEYVKRSGGMFMDMTIHDFDMARYLSNSDVVDVTVKADNLVDPEIGKCDDVDTAIILLTFENGAIGVIDNSRQAVYGYDQRIEVFGNKGLVSADNEEITNVRIANEKGTSIDPLKNFFLDRYHEAYEKEIESFAASILQKQPLVCSGEDGQKAELLAKAARISHLEQRTVKLAELEEQATV